MFVKTIFISKQISLFIEFFGLEGPMAAGGVVEDGVQALPAATAGNSNGGGGSNLATPTRTRKNFPQTWIWSNVTIGYT